MLRSLQEILGYRLDATGGKMGLVEDFYFDDREWVVRYLVADTANWLPGRRVLISPASVGEPDWNAQKVPISLSKEQIEQSPSIGVDKPVSRQHEAALAGYYDWPTYWAPLGMPTVGIIPPREAPSRQQPKESATEHRDIHLRSFSEVTGYQIHASDGQIGHVHDFIAQTDDWVIRYLGVDTRKWLPGRKVLLSPDWIDRISYTRGEVLVAVNRQAVKAGPEYDPSEPVNRKYEMRLYDYYGMPRYWETPKRTQARQDAQRA